MTGKRDREESHWLQLHDKLASQWRNMSGTPFSDPSLPISFFERWSGSDGRIEFKIKCFSPRSMTEQHSIEKDEGHAFRYSFRLVRFCCHPRYAVVELHLLPILSSVTSLLIRV
ncbi:hypothetical protein PROFUN_12221 [Planoprotostelium fungivorum]|uniref:Uncharacterized protein n=1 Tax=Planoprotostelium fungivorum TaxID=1890364 RepID=A0A2P6N861_9EUKA|nr:hypothetical protein PROFUN_12221 [Planoprotostelium fungivorum]